jgi:hypothetical protein
MNSFENFYNKFGLGEYPFSTFTTEKENNLFEIFVKPSNYT